MKIPRFLTHPILVIFTAAAFLFLVTGCEKAVTYYDKDGKPYTVKEPDPWGTIGGILLTCIIIGAIAAAADSNADSNSVSSLSNRHGTMFAYAGNKSFVTDASSGMYSSAKCFELLDMEGNTVSRHRIDMDKLQTSKPLVDISEVQVSIEVNKRTLRKLVREIKRTSNLSSVPESIKADVSFLPDESDALKINAVSTPQPETDSGGKISELILASPHGFYRIISVPDRKSGRVGVTVSQLD